MSSRHNITAELRVPRPAYDVDHPATTLWSAGFETPPYSLASVGFTTSAPANATHGTSSYFHTGSSAAYPYVKDVTAAAGTHAAYFYKTLTGFSIGRSYTFAIWVYAPATTASYSNRVRVGISGIGDSSYTTISTSWQRVFYTFTATSTSHILRINADELDAATTFSRFYLDSVSVVRNAWTQHFAASTDEIPLSIKEAALTLDEGWTPYVQVTLTCALLDEQYLEFTDPREAARLTVTATRDGVPREFDLTLRSRTVDHVAAELTITAGSDEYLLLDRARVATTPNDSYLTYQGDLRDLVNAVLTSTLSTTLETDAGATANLTIYADSTNEITNPSAEYTTLGWTTEDCTLTRLASTAGGVSGDYVFRLTSPTNSNSYIYSDPISVTPGEVYVASANFQGDTGPTGTEHARARKIVITEAGSGNHVASSSPGTLGVSSMQRLSVEVTIPPKVTSIRVRLYGGYATSMNIKWDAVRFSEWTGGPNDVEFFSGSSTDNSIYAYDWTGTAHESTSTRTELTGTGRTADLFTWYPGMSAWDFLSPLVEAAGLRLFCDEDREWHLVNPTTWTAPGTVTLAARINLTDASDTIDFGDDQWYDGVVIKYSWLSRYAEPKVRYDAAGSGSKVLLIERTRAWPGAGAAAAILSRVSRKGRVLDLSAISDYTTTPGMAFEATLPSTPEQTGRLSAVTWNFPADEMTVKTRD